jgi:predicted nucleic acid-binding protein
MKRSASAHALSLDAVLAIANTRHLGRIRALVVEDWSS